MITADISIVPIGTSSTSVSEFVVKAEKVLAEFPEVEYELTAMSTQISSKNIEIIFEVFKKMHMEVAGNGTQRVYTNIKIDDRRDKDNSMREKVESVLAKL